MKKHDLFLAIMWMGVLAGVQPFGIAEIPIPWLAAAVVVHLVVVAACRSWNTLCRRFRDRSGALTMLAYLPGNLGRDVVAILRCRRPRAIAGWLATASGR